VTSGSSQTRLLNVSNATWISSAVDFTSRLCRPRATPLRGEVGQLARRGACTLLLFNRLATTTIACRTVLAQADPSSIEDPTYIWRNALRRVRIIRRIGHERAWPSRSRPACCGTSAAALRLRSGLWRTGCGMALLRPFGAAQGLRRASSASHRGPSDRRSSSVGRKTSAVNG